MIRGGGTISVIAEYFQAKEITGIALSPEAIAFCKSNYTYEHVHFFEGDSENMPFNDIFEVVTNVESASSYPNIQKFFKEIYRALKPNGYFLYTDVLPTELIPGYLSFLQEMGFTLEIDRDITHNVLLSCDETAKRHATAFGKDNEFTDNFYLYRVPKSIQRWKMERQPIGYLDLKNIIEAYSGGFK